MKEEEPDKEKEATKKSLVIIQDAEILPEEDIKALAGLKGELEHGFIHGQIFRTRTEAEVSVLNDLKFPTPDSKFWQSVREQQVHFTELVMLSYEYKKNLKEIEIIQADIMEFEDKRDNGLKNYELMKLNAEIDIKKIEIAQKSFIAANHRRTAQGRIAEIVNWHEINTQLEPNMQFSKDDVNEHQLGSYAQRFINEYLIFKQHSPKNKSVPEVRNLIGLLVSALNKAKDAGILDNVLEPYSKNHRQTIMSVWKSHTTHEGVVAHG